MAGRETTEGRLCNSKAGEGGTGNWSRAAVTRELVDDLVWRVRESLFTFRTDRGLVGERSDTDSDSEEGPDGGGLSPSATTTVDRLAGRGVILIPRLAGVVLLRGRVVGCCAVDCMMSYQEAEEDDDLRAFREKKKEDIGQRKRLRRRATVPRQMRRPAWDNWREGVGVESEADLSNSSPHVPTRAQPGRQGHSAGPLCIDG